MGTGTSGANTPVGFKQMRSFGHLLVHPLLQIHWRNAILADAHGNYRAGFTTIALLAALGSFFFLLARRPARPLRAA